MSSGYTPVFGSVFTGTLHGKWPDIGLWLCVLGMADRNGVVDVTPQYIASATGLPVDDVVACMARFCDPDPYSRTAEQEGRRLVLLEPPRPWGWRIVNHGKYREKARLQSRDAARTASGDDAARKRGARADVPRSPPESPALPPSDSDSDRNKTKTPERAYTREGKSRNEQEERAALAEARRRELASLESEFVGLGFRTALAIETPGGYRTAFKAWKEEQRVRGNPVAEGARA